MTSVDMSCRRWRQQAAVLTAWREHCRARAAWQALAGCAAAAGRQHAAASKGCAHNCPGLAFVLQFALSPSARVLSFSTHESTICRLAWASQQYLAACHLSFAFRATPSGSIKIMELRYSVKTVIFSSWVYTIELFNENNFCVSFPDLSPLPQGAAAAGSPPAAGVGGCRC